jgi:hypothetical protein
MVLALQEATEIEIKAESPTMLFDSHVAQLVHDEHCA